MSASLPVPSASMRTALRNMAWVLGDKALAMALGLLIVGLIARSLGPVGSGHFAYAAALLQVGLGLSLVCSGSALLPRFCRINAALPGAMANVFVVRMLVSVVATLAMLAWCWLAIEDPQRRLVSMILVLAVPLMEPFHVIALYWLSRNHNRPNIIARGLGLLLRTAIVALGLHLGAPLWLIAAAWVFEAGLNAAIQCAQLHLAMPAQRFARYVRESRARAYFGFGVRFVLSLWLQSLFIRLDRLLLAERMDSEPFGVYAVAMQLTEVWIQVAYLIGISMATAFLYRRIREGRFALAFFGTAAAMTGVGLAGLGAAWLFGPWLLRVVFGPRFDGSLPFLLAGMAVAVLLFANQIVQLTLTTLDRPRLLVLSWATAVLVAAPLIWFGYPAWGAFSGPIGLAAGVVSGWLVQLARASVVHDALRG